MYTYGLLMLMYGRNHHSRSSNYPLIKKKKKDLDGHHLYLVAGAAGSEEVGQLLPAGLLHLRLQEVL